MYLRSLHLKNVVPRFVRVPEHLQESNTKKEHIRTLSKHPEAV